MILRIGELIFHIFSLLPTLAEYNYMNHTGSYISSSKYTTAVHVNIVRSLFFCACAT